jgi:hypothetical protein
MRLKMVSALLLLVAWLERCYAWGQSQPLDEPAPLFSHLLPDVMLAVVVLGVGVALHSTMQRRASGAPRMQTA